MINYYGYFHDYTIARNKAITALEERKFEEAMGYTERARFSFFYDNIDNKFKDLLTSCFNDLDLMITTKHVGNLDSYEKYKQSEMQSSSELRKLAKILDQNQK